MLMAYQDGCVYLGKGMHQATISGDIIKLIYEVMKKNIQNSSTALSDPSRIVNNLKTPRLGYYGLSDEYYFFSGANRMLRSFIEKSITSAHVEKTTGLTDSMIDGIARCGEVVPLEMESSKEGQKILLGFARAVVSMAVQKVLNHSGIKVLTSTTFALARNEIGDAETRGGYRYEGFIPPGIEHIRDIQDHRIQ